MLRQFVQPIIAALLVTAPAVAQGPAAPDGHKSGAAAVGISLLGTAAPIAIALASDHGAARGWLLFYGGVFGPSTGYFYVGRPGKVFGAGIPRLAIALVTSAGIVAACGGNVIWGCEDEATANAISIFGLGAFVASAVFDLAQVARAAGEWNARHAPPPVQVTPLINPADRAGGLAVRVNF